MKEKWFSTVVNDDDSFTMIADKSKMKDVPNSEYSFKVKLDDGVSQLKKN